MSKTNTFETDVLSLIFNNTNIADLGDVTGVQGSGAAGNLHIALFTADPTEAGTQTSEADFGAYARQAVPRSGAGWTVAGDTVSNAALITFPEATSGSNIITHFGVMDSAAAGTMLFHGILGTSRTVTTGVTLEFAIGALTVQED